MWSRGGCSSTAGSDVIYLLRHGQTEFNLAGRYQGRVDSPMTPQGLRQSERMGHALARLVEPGNVVLMASPLPRALRSAQIVGDALGVAPKVEPRLIEVDIGQWEGRTADEIDTGWPGARAGFRRNEWFFGAPGGESYAMVAERMTTLIADLAQRPDRIHVLVGHAISGRVLRGLHAGLEPAKAMRLEIPQDAFFALDDDGTLRRITLPVE